MRSLLSDDLVITLSGGFRVSVAALQLAWHLESIGVWIDVRDPRAVTLRPSHLVPDDDLPLLREHKADLARLATYRAEPPA